MAGFFVPLAIPGLLAGKIDWAVSRVRLGGVLE